jgi:hypothetical protein
VSAEQFDLFGEPVARWTDPETSHEAAASVVRLTVVRQAIMDLLGKHPDGLTDQEIAALYSGPQASPSGLRTRRAELVDGGFVADSGRRSTTASGRRTIVWVLTA